VLSCVFHLSCTAHALKEVASTVYRADDLLSGSGEGLVQTHGRCTATNSHTLIY